MTDEILDTAKELPRILLDVIAAHGVKTVVCSPGSRNAPLLVAAEARKGLTKHVIIDERSAAFVALGIAMVSRKPVALICTSGTAVLNYAPAVAEAYYHGIPLIVISADRPMEWIDQDDSQTLRQPGALGNFVKATYSLSDRDRDDRPGWYVNRIANDAMLTALAPKQGPVHINVRLSPPLGATAPFEESEVRVIRRIASTPVPDKEVIKSLAAQLMGKKVLLVAGFMEPDARLNRAVGRFRQHPNVAVMAETISNLHLPAEDYAVDSALCAAKEQTLMDLAPDVVITLGGALVSRKLKEYLRKCSVGEKSLEHWSVGYNHTTVDCFQALSLRIEADPGRFMAALTAELAHELRMAHYPINAATDYSRNWQKAKKAGIRRVSKRVDIFKWSDLKALAYVFSHIPGDTNVFLSNGTSVRYAQILTRELPHAEYCNRGVSGIDGTTSTAIGGALAYSGPTILITGDMSLAYDVSAFHTMLSVRSDLKIILLNNGGGGIFRFIPSTADLECRERYFCVPSVNPNLGIPGRFNRFECRSYSGIQRELKKFLEVPGPAILEIKTNPEMSAEALKRLLN